METVKKSFGLTSWDENTSSQNFKQRDDLPKFEYLRLKDGDNNVRIVTKPYRFYMVRFKNATDKGFGKRVNTAFPLHENCPAVVDAGMKAKERYLVGVIDRTDQQLRILDVSILTYEEIQSLKNDIEWGDPENYDVNIRRNSKAKTPAAFYKVMPRGKAPLSDVDVAKLTEQKESLEKVLALRTTPPKPETVRKRLVELGWDGRVVSAASEESELEETGEDAYNFKRPQAQAS